MILSKIEIALPGMFACQIKWPFELWPVYSVFWPSADELIIFCRYHVISGCLSVPLGSGQASARETHIVTVGGQELGTGDDSSISSTACMLRPPCLPSM